MITTELQDTLNNALQDALARRHEYLTLDHLLLALLKEKTAGEVIKNCGGNADELRKQLDKFLNETVEKLPPGKKQSPEPSAAFERVLSRAAMQAESSSQSFIDGDNVLAAMFQ